MATITHAKTVTISDPTQAELNAQIALGNYPPGTLLADIALSSDYNAAHSFSLGANENFVTNAEKTTIANAVTGPASSVDGLLSAYNGATGKIIKTTSFLAGFDTVAPNDVAPVASILAYDPAFTNIDLALVLKGTGSLMLGIPDGTNVGGNKRGTSAIDLQPARGAATQVASGTFSVAIGALNTASNNSSVALGVGNNISGFGGVGIGRSNTVSSGLGFSIGSLNTVSGSSTGALGYQCNIAGSYSYGFGYRCIVTAAGGYTFVAGLFVKSSATSAMVFGKGVGSGQELHNTVANSIWLGVNTTVPSLAIWNGGGVGLFGRVSIGTATEPTVGSIFDVVSITKGARPFPPMTDAQMNAIVSPAGGLGVYSTDAAAFKYHNGAVWGAIGGGAGNFPLVKNSTDVAEILTITSGFQFLCNGSFENNGDIINNGDFAIL